MQYDDYLQFRLPHDKKYRAKAAADWRGEAVSEVLRRFLDKYIEAVEEAMKKEQSEVV